MKLDLSKGWTHPISDNPDKQQGIKSLPLGHRSSGFITKRKIVGDHQGGKEYTEGPPGIPKEKLKRRVPLHTRSDRHADSAPGTPNGKHLSGRECHCGGCSTGQKKK